MSQRGKISNLEVLLACEMNPPVGPRRPGNSLTRLMALTGQPAKVCLAAIERCIPRWCECGVSPRYAWVVGYCEAKGAKELARLEAENPEEAAKLRARIAELEAQPLDAPRGQEASDAK